MFKKQFEIRWSDVDANKHLANSAYTNYMSQMRILAFNQAGLTMDVMTHLNLAPVVFYEHTYYFKEVRENNVIVSFELSGLSNDGMFFSFYHHFYDSNGRNLAFSEMLGAWISYDKRQLMSLPDNYTSSINDLPKSADFKVLTKADTRKFNVKPKDISL